MTNFVQLEGFEKTSLKKSFGLSCSFSLGLNKTFSFMSSSAHQFTNLKTSYEVMGFKLVNFHCTVTIYVTGYAVAWLQLSEPNLCYL